MADELIHGVLVIQNDLFNHQKAPLILEHDLEHNNAIPLANKIQDLNVLNQVDEQVFEEEELLNLQGEYLGNGNFPHHNGAGISPEPPVSLVHSEYADSLVSFDESEIRDTSSSGPGMEHGCYFDVYYSDSSELSDFEEYNEFQLGKWAESLSRKRNSPEQLRSSGNDFNTETLASTNRYDDSEIFQPNPPNSPANVRADLNECGSVLQFSESVMYAEFGLDPEERSCNYYARADRQPTSSRRSGRRDNLFLYIGSFMIIRVFVVTLMFIACLVGLIPESYIGAVLNLWFLVVIAASAFFFMATRSKKKETPEGSECGSTCIWINREH